MLHRGCYLNLLQKPAYSHVTTTTPNKTRLCTNAPRIPSLGRSFQRESCPPSLVQQALAEAVSHLSLNNLSPPQLMSTWTHWTLGLAPQAWPPSWALGLSTAFLACTFAATLAAYLDAYLKSGPPKLLMTPTGFNTAVVGECPTLTSSYQPLPFITNGHVETIFASKFRSCPKLDYERVCLLTGDGGCVALDAERMDVLPVDAPVVILLPGLTGGSHDSYVCHAVENARKNGIRAVVFNGRGTAGSEITTPQYYSACNTKDLRVVVEHVRGKYWLSPVLMAAGWSLGANILTKYLGEEGSNTPIQAAISMCNPFNLPISMAAFDKGFNKVYDANLASSMRAIMAKHDGVWSSYTEGHMLVDQARAAKTVRQFDDAITRRCFGWSSVDEYYEMASSCRYVSKVTIPLLCLQALDDPIAPKEAIPYEGIASNPNVILVTTRCGGHLGWVAGDGAPLGRPWSDQAMMEFMGAVVARLGERQGAKLATAGDMAAVPS